MLCPANIWQKPPFQRSGLTIVFVAVELFLGAIKKLPPAAFG